MKGVRERWRERKRANTCMYLLQTHFQSHAHILVLTCIGDGKTVGGLYIVDMWDQVKGGFRSIRAGVVKEDS